MNAPKLSFTAPAWDEADCIEATVREALEALDAAGLEGEVVIADDGSTDATPELLAGLADADPRVRVVTLPENSGYGVAMRAALAAARGEYVATIDSDGQFDPADAPRLLAYLEHEGFDLVNGIRHKDDGALRVLADHGLRGVVRGLFGVRVRDPNCALKVVRRAWIAAQPLEANGYPFPSEVVIRAHRDGLAIGELPVSHRPRAGGRSKLNLLRTARRATLFFLRLRLSLA